MKKHKICIIGDGLSGLITAQTLSRLDVQIDLVSNKPNIKKKDNRTTAISPSNYKFISESLPIKSSFFFKVKKVGLYHEEKNNKITNFLNFENLGKDVMLIFQNENLKKILLSNIVKNKKVNILKGDVKKIDNTKTSISIKNKEKFYDIIILCTGRENQINEKIFNNRHIKEDKKEIAYTSIITHNHKITESRQYFLKEGPLAILPINNKKFSLIWSMSNKYNSFTNEDIKKIIKKRLKNIFSEQSKFNINQISSFPIYFKFNREYFTKNIIALGESVYNFYPIAGQGFNLILRDISVLYKKIEENISLGLDIKNSSIIKNVFLERKPENLLLGLGISFTHKFFRYNKFTDPLKNSLLKDISKFPIIKKIGLKLADKGIF